VFFENLSRTFKFHYNPTRITDSLYEYLCTFYIVSRWILLIVRNVSDKICRENPYTHFVVFLSCRLWDNTTYVVILYIWYDICDIIWYMMMWCYMIRNDMMWYSMIYMIYDIRCDMIRNDMMWYDIWYIWYNMIYDVMWYDKKCTIWCGIIWYMIWYIWYNMKYVWYDKKWYMI